MCIRHALVVKTLAWINKIRLMTCFVGLCAPGNDQKSATILMKPLPSTVPALGSLSCRYFLVVGSLRSGGK